MTATLSIQRARTDHILGALFDSSLKAKAVFDPQASKLQVDAAIRPRNDQLVGALVEALDVPYLPLLRSAWSKVLPVSQAMKETRETPDSRRFVELSSHTVRSVHHPDLIIEVNGARHRQRVNLELELRFEIQSVGLVIESGRITAVTPGEARVAATLQGLGGFQVEVESRPVDVGAALRRAAVPGPIPAST